MLNLTPIEAAYIAGFVDGEGSIFVYKTHAHGFEVYNDVVSITNTDRAVLQYIADVTGLGNVNVHQRQKGRNKASWVWRLYSYNAHTFLQAILPYLRVKRQLAELMLMFPRGKSGEALSQELHDIRRDICLKIKAINASISEQGVSTIPTGSTAEADAAGSAQVPKKERDIVRSLRRRGADADYEEI